MVKKTQNANQKKPPNIALFSRDQQLYNSSNYLRIRIEFAHFIQMSFINKSWYGIYMH